MHFSFSFQVPRSILHTLGLFGVVALTACTTPGPNAVPGEPFDPFEVGNRKTHEFNKSLDRTLLRPSGDAYSNIPDDIQTSVSNFADNLALPSEAVNKLLQGDLLGMLQNSYRFLVNSTLGFGGLFDPATDFGVPAAPTDFGETLFVWGVQEGAYVELPFVGPSTERAAVGKVVDLFTNPLSYVLPSPEKYVGNVASLASKIGDRGRYADTIDSILYDSVDSYAQSRTIYLQNRRFDLGDEGGDAYLDPYDDPYGDPYAE